MTASKIVMSAASGVGGGAVEFVGAASADEPNGATINLDISTIGIQSGDIIIASHGIGEDANFTSLMTTASSGYTDIATRFQNDTYDVNLKTRAKIADGTETTFSVSGGTFSSSVIAIVMVFRGTNGTIPTDVASGLLVNSGTSNTDDINWPLVTGLSSGECLVYVGATGHVSGFRFYSNATDMDGTQQENESDDEDLTHMMAYKLITTETSFDANTWFCTGNTFSSAVAYHIIKLSP